MGGKKAIVRGALEEEEVESRLGPLFAFDERLCGS